MTVAELIEKLQDLNPALVVVIELKDAEKGHVSDTADTVEVIGCTEVRIVG